MAPPTEGAFLIPRRGISSSEIHFCWRQNYRIISWLFLNFPRGWNPGCGTFSQITAPKNKEDSSCTKVHIIYGYIYHMIGEVKWEKAWIIIKKMVARGRTRRTPGLQEVAKWSGMTELCLWYIQELQAIYESNAYHLGLLDPTSGPWRMETGTRAFNVTVAMVSDMDWAE